MNPAHQTITKQRPGRPPNQDFTGDVLALPDGTVRRVRNVKIDEHTTLRVPAGITRANRINAITGVNYSIWQFKVQNIRLSIKDRDRSAAESLVESVNALVQLCDAPYRAVQEYKRKMAAQERQSKNINTGFIGIEVVSKYVPSTRTVGYTLRYRTTLSSGLPYSKSVAVTKSNMTDFAKQMSRLLALREAVTSGAVNTKVSNNGYWKMIKNGLVRGPNVISLPPSFHQQWKDNETMALSRGRGDGWTDPYTGEEV